ncbi:MAG: nucleotidyltransferase family protein [Gammaproteobacteria bacterium]|nr:nucleotidyltransferase family protein [Gammaproteobacteria bacterium]
MKDRPLLLTAVLRDVVSTIEASRRRIAVIVDSNGYLLGTLTDGDVRRCLLAGGTLGTFAMDAMNKNPVIAKVGSTDQLLLDLMRGANILAIPLVDANKRFVKIVHISELGEDRLEEKSGFELAVIMAGGEGNRLRPLTENIPKPMVDVGGIPLLERQVCRLVKAGIKHLYISLNYLGHVIEDHFQDGSAFGIRIDYLREDEKLGTAGALSLLPNGINETMLVMNGDVLTTSNLNSLYTYHKNNKALITVAAVEHQVNIPFGVIKSEGVYAVDIEEKPSQKYLCNAGIYALSSDALGMIPGETFCNMTDIIRDCFSKNKPVAVFPLHEYWSDVGTLDDLEKARALFKKSEELYER